MITQKIRGWHPRTAMQVNIKFLYKRIAHRVPFRAVSWDTV